MVIKKKFTSIFIYTLIGSQMLFANDLLQNLGQGDYKNQSCIGACVSFDEVFNESDSSSNMAYKIYGSLKYEKNFSKRGAYNNSTFESLTISDSKFERNNFNSTIIDQVVIKNTQFLKPNFSKNETRILCKMKR